MNEGRSQYIGIILISILVYILMVRSCKPEVNESTNTTTDSTKVESVSNNGLAANATTAKDDSTWVISAEGDSILMSTKQLAAQSNMGAFYPFAQGEEKTFVLENDLLKVTLSNKGAQVKEVELKAFKTFDKNPLILVQNSQEVNYTLALNNATNSTVQTKDLYFEASEGNGGITFTAKTASGGSITFAYALSEGSYLVDYTVAFENLSKDVKASDKIALDWKYDAINQEQDLSSEKTKSTAYWSEKEADVEHLAIGKSKEQSIENPIQWLSFKQRFFNTTLLSSFDANSTKVSTVIDNEDSTKVAQYLANVSLENTGKPYEMQFYFGPNDYKLLKSFDNEMHQVVELSADFFLFKWVKYINAWLIIPLFNFIEKFIPNYGVIILIMTLVIKLILMPLTFKSYVSTAKTKVLKPELEALKEKFGDDAAGYSKAQMDLYSKTGVSMFGGCLPMLLQMPFLLAMFYFFPSSIELRQESFLWAQDLSSFDTVPWLTFSKEIWLLGSHISIFSVLMTISSILMAVFNPQMQSQPTQPGMEMLKYMPYIFPFFLFFLFNSFPAALTYYYFLSNMITFGQQFIINKFFIDEDKIKEQIEENKKKPVKKSKFAEKMEEIYKQQQEVQTKKK